ncbi:hypothetical protein BOTBODRAFT_158437 [Botryobasidium botryosum FD-172 SS1]|uniref:BTB domain-containing protein n=1 Tax=Botryobasidium botryosum (strain FD-172 SS1) TaxID=930990 RepID=A0A067MHD2_BOTB1|nr:hypothetical protein BOTBODRAFT_158437 [Botryobasidium botryosum FD-172 SS1]
MTTNPSHILIARSSRSAPPHATLSNPTPTETHASGIFPRVSSSPPWFLEVEDKEVTDEEDENAEEQVASDPIEVDPTFKPDYSWPGSVKITVEATTFWGHKDVLVFASPFFEALLSGNWAETGRPSSLSSGITISVAPSTTDPELPRSEPDTADKDSDDWERSEIEPFVMSEDESEKFGSSTVDRARTASLEKLQGKKSAIRQHIAKEGKGKQRVDASQPSAVIQLKEEKASTFHDFLKFVYPHLNCTITWNNVEGLMGISHKLVVPSLQAACLDFLLTHAAGKPIKAMRIAEFFQEEELYRESSRFVLDNPGDRSDLELHTLSLDTLWKLEKRRNWFLERVLKLGLVSIAKEYQCCSTCPDPSNCARLLEEKWRQGYHASFRFGPPQPSMVYRYLRLLEGISPPLSLTHLSCQTCAKSWVATLFDRMFSLGVRGSGTDTAPLGGRVGTTGPGPRRHFLFCSLNDSKEAMKVRAKARETLYQSNI